MNKTREKAMREKWRLANSTLTFRRFKKNSLSPPSERPAPAQSHEANNIRILQMGGGRQSLVNRAYGKMKRAGVYATRKRS